LRDGDRRNDSCYNKLLKTTVKILCYEEKREQVLHKELSKSEIFKRPYEGYIIKTQYLKPNQEIDLVCFKQMSNVIEVFKIEPELKRLDCSDLIRTIDTQIDYLVPENRNYNEIVANIVTLAKNNVVEWLTDNKHFLQDTRINQIWIYGEKKTTRGNPFRFHPKHLDLDYLIPALKKIERGENWEN
jgi:hypothetical protein